MHLARYTVSNDGISISVLIHQKSDLVFFQLMHLVQENSDKVGCRCLIGWLAGCTFVDGKPSVYLCYCVVFTAA